jgi:PadR family transcriptional regulator PadR
MESQFRRGILDACVLAVLERGESYGYQMVKDIKTFIDITESTLYPILKRLENANMLTVFTQEHNGRLRKYYKITDEGRSHITQLLNEWEEVVKIYQYITKEREERHD